MMFDSSSKKQIESAVLMATTPGKAPTTTKPAKAPTGKAYNAKKAPTIGVEQALITPDMAKKIVTRNEGNRPAGKAHVADFEAIIRDGKWFHGSVITIDRDGNVVDGQHRLTAIANAGIPVWAVLHRKVDREEAFNGIDVNVRVRGAGDMIAVLRPGTLNHVRHAAVAGAMIRGIARGGAKTRAREVADFGLEHFDTIQEFMGLLPAVDFDAPVVAAFCNAARADESRRSGKIPARIVRSLAQRMAKGVDMKANDPMFVLRERLKREKQAKTRRIRGAEVYALCVGPIIAASEGRTISRTEPTSRDFGEW